MVQLLSHERDLFTRMKPQAECVGGTASIDRTAELGIVCDAGEEQHGDPGGEERATKWLDRVLICQFVPRHRSASMRELVRDFMSDQPGTQFINVGTQVGVQGGGVVYGGVHFGGVSEEGARARRPK